MAKHQDSFQGSSLIVLIVSMPKQIVFVTCNPTYTSAEHIAVRGSGLERLVL